MLAFCWINWQHVDKNYKLMPSFWLFYRNTSLGFFSPTQPSSLPPTSLNLQPQRRRPSWRFWFQIRESWPWGKKYIKSKRYYDNLHIRFFTKKSINLPCLSYSIKYFTYFPLKILLQYLLYIQNLTWWQRDLISLSNTFKYKSSIY